jgi:hypothetical protein
VAGVVTLALVGSLVAGCGAVDIRATDASGPARTACRALVDHLPQRVADQQRRDTEGSSLGAAWGDPAIVLRCGVGTPEGYSPAAPCQRVNGVDWFVPEDQIAHQDRDVTLTTLGRTPRVEVFVPAEYRPPDAVLVDLAASIRKGTREVSPCA